MRPSILRSSRISLSLFTLLASALGVGCDGRRDAGDAGPDAGLDAATDAPADTAVDTRGGDAASDGPTCTFDGAPEAQLPDPVPHTPRWAFEPWISKDISDTDDTYAFVQGFHDRDIPVGVVVLDSPWETSYNTFVPNPVRYHDFARLVGDMHAQSVRVVLWITPMVNSSSFDAEMGGDIYDGPAENFAEGVRCGFYVERGRTFSWWKGRGAGVDFFNPLARAWFHQFQNGVLDAGIDGWKLDFAENYITVDPVSTAQGPVPHQQYSETYYRDYLAYGASRRGPDFLTMTRAWDASYNFAGRFYARPENSPVSWMGDNRRDWFGLGDALDEMFRSSQAGYVVVGSDIGGYLDHDDLNLAGPVIPFSQTVFARWTAVGALSPFMQLHGRANITPWTVPDRPDETVTLYRYWATLHHELVPFFDSLATQGWAAGPPYVAIVRPVGDPTTWAGDYRYQLGDAFLVAPVLDDTGIRDIALPAGANWYDWWNPSADAIPGGTTLRGYDSSDRTRIPLFVRAGAIVPADVSSSLTGLGTNASQGALTVLVYPNAGGSQFVVREADGSTVMLSEMPSGGGVVINVGPRARDVILRVRTDAANTVASVDGAMMSSTADRTSFDANAGDFWVDTVTRSDWVRVRAGTSAAVVTLSP